MLRRMEKALYRPLLHLAATQHYDDIVGHLGDHAHVVRDEDDRGAQVLLQFADRIQDLRLDGHIQRRRRLVGNQQARPARQRHRDHHALAHAAGKLVRIAVQHLRRVGQADLLQQRPRRFTRGGAREPLVQDDGFGHLVAHGEDRVQRGHRLLENHRHVVAADGAHVVFRNTRQVDFAASPCPAAECCR